jgi:hypothetical protein
MTPGHFTLKMEAAWASKTLAPYFGYVRCYNCMAITPITVIEDYENYDVLIITTLRILARLS